jgi:hypothetical protein
MKKSFKMFCEFMEESLKRLGKYFFHRRNNPGGGISGMDL